MGVITVVGEHGETVAQGSGGNQQINRVNPSSWPQSIKSAWISRAVTPARWCNSTPA
jgi:hypothetical protein